jgi:hypothetical protein
MTTTARQATRRIITDTDVLAALVILGAEFETCELCTLPAAELFARTDNRDGAEIECCEHCANTADVSPIAD